ncbi:hypothetical protein M422DRAFT_232076 [Sphaerobolus stellatus SS14]|uniref:Linoleate 8R-lipoxygenase n=1 Tax=Sphaerobolus stellatus (strain SS14) TaxID=990650 RepID=A0A0C9U2M7_SPHS4|nr:hypothetical protein M422DRAFT_232076 [Sphaerobolus stellatus SS14]
MSVPLAPLEEPRTGVLETIQNYIKRGSPLSWGTLEAGLDAALHQSGEGIDDRKFLLENILVFMSRLSPSSPLLSSLSTRVEHFLIDFLYKDLPHPPATFLGSVATVKTADDQNVGLRGFAWREADGSFNNSVMPHLGAAHQPYARSVAAAHVSPPSTLPDPGLVFDMLLKRKKDVDHPTGLSALFFAFANLIIHSLFRTSRDNSSINDTSSYLDLSPLYGVDAKEQETVRKFAGTGMLYEDTFADRRLLGMPPATPALLVVFNRNHNFIAKRILEIDEQNKYSKDLFPNDETARKRQDDEIFNRARLVNCGAFMQVIMRDYVGCILHMIPDGNPWHLRPLDEIRDSTHEIAPRGEGNVCSVEFNLLYRWHATTSSKDEKWLDGVFREFGDGVSSDNMTEQQFYQAAGRAIVSQSSGPTKTWTFGGLTRDPNTGRFQDNDLAHVLQSATADMAQAFRARGIPAAFKVIEILGIKEARSWGVCSLNEFRKFLGLKPYKSFAEWNPDPEVHLVAERLYHDIENMELYVGMQAEEARPSRPGSGLASGYTMSRSILADAVALIRGDRFLTIEYTPHNLTSWGYQDCETTNDNGSLGGMLTKLLFRALPNHYTPNSIYAHFPFMVPAHTHETMKKWANWTDTPTSIKTYNWDPPRALERIIEINDAAAVATILSDTVRFATPYDSYLSILTQNHGFYFGAGDSARNQRNGALIERVLFTKEKIAQHASFYYDQTTTLLAEKSFMASGSTTRTVDVVREVINCLPLHWITNRVVGLSLKTVDNPTGRHTEQELFGYLAVIFSYIYFNIEPVNSWFLEQHSNKAIKILHAEISEKIRTTPSSIFGTVKNLISHAGSSDLTALHELLHEAHGVDDSQDIVYNILGIIVNSATNWSRAMTHVIEFYLDSPDKDVIIGLSRGKSTAETEAVLVGYVREALRLNPPVAGVLREVARGQTAIVQGQTLRQDTRVYVNLKAALKADSIDNAAEVHPQRGRIPALSFVPGAHSSLNEEFSERTMAQVLRAVFSRKNLRRANGTSGRLATFDTAFHGTLQPMYLDWKAAVTPWPLSLVLQYDA